MLDSITQKNLTSLHTNEQLENMPEHSARGQKYDSRSLHKNSSLIENMGYSNNRSESFGPAVVSHLNQAQASIKQKQENTLQKNLENLNTITTKTSDRVSLSSDALELAKFKNQKDNNLKAELAQAQLNKNNIVQNNNMLRHTEPLNKTILDENINTNTTNINDTNIIKTSSEISDADTNNDIKPEPTLSIGKSILSFLSGLQNRLLGRAVEAYEQSSQEIPEKGSRLYLKV